MSSMIRLFQALDWIDNNDSLADIGCDHGYLAIEAIKKGVSFVQLIDNKQGPLDSAKKNLEKNDLLNSQNVLLTLASGLTNLDERIDTVAILGMGGELIAQILEEGESKINNVNKFILEANTKNHILRKFLFDHKYEIIEEKIVKENRKFYELILARKTDVLIDYDDCDLIFGPCLKREKSPLFKEKWLKIYQDYQKILNNSNKHLEKILYESKLIEEVLCLK